VDNLARRRRHALFWRVGAVVLTFCAIAAATLAIGEIADPSLAPVDVVLTNERGADAGRLRLQPAVTRYQLWRGLQGRHHLRPDTGMLFEFARPMHVCFWMLHTPMPLMVLFFDASRRFVGSAYMAPETLTRHCPGAEVRYAIELAPGAVRASEIKGFAFGNY
jgi:uncharacterized membrane protein (UPF0127 family)